MNERPPVFMDGGPFAVLGSLYINLSNTNKRAGIVRIDNIVDKTHSSAEYTGSLSYKAAIDVTMAAVGVIDAKNIVMRMFFPSSTKDAAPNKARTPARTTGYTTSRRPTGR